MATLEKLADLKPRASLTQEEFDTRRQSCSKAGLTGSVLLNQ